MLKASWFDRHASSKRYEGGIHVTFDAATLSGTAGSFIAWLASAVNLVLIQLLGASVLSGCSAELLVPRSGFRPSRGTWRLPKTRFHRERCGTSA